MDYRWELRRGGKKTECPACHQMRFVPYVSSKDHATLAGEEYGRCDREQNCGYHKYPNGKDDAGVQVVQLPPEQPIRFYPAAVQPSLRSTLFGYVASHWGVSNAIEAFTAYKVGAEAERTIFWQIDKNGFIRGGKIIPYKRDGHRNKSDQHPANWVHALRHWKNAYTGNRLEQCFFGEHLLNGNDKPVAIVESEKTALVMSMLSRRFIWLASGGSQGLKNESKNAALKGRRVMLFPDNGQYWNWKATADKYGWECDKTLETEYIFEGCDLLDMVEAGVFGNDLILKQ